MRYLIGFGIGMSGIRIRILTVKGLFFLFKDTYTSSYKAAAKAVADSSLQLDQDDDDDDEVCV